MANEINVSNVIAGQLQQSQQAPRAADKKAVNKPESAAKVETQVAVNVAAVDDKDKEASTEVPRKELEVAIDAMAKFVKQQDRNLEFSIDDTTGKSLVKVVDGESGKVIRQLPSEQALELAQRLEEGKGGMIEEFV
jgi:flagellar protein FlaG